MVRRLGGLAAAGLDRVSLIPGGGDLGLADTSRSLELIADHVRPRLALAEAAP